MKLKEGFALRSVCGEYVVSPTGLKMMNFNKLLSLNSTAAYLWEKFYGSEFTVEDLAKALVEQYEIGEEIALPDCERLVNYWRDAEVLED